MISNNKKLAQIVIEVFLSGDMLHIGKTTETLRTGNGLLLTDTVTRSLKALFGFEPTIFTDHGDRFTMLFIGPVDDGITPSVIENTVIRNSLPNTTTAIIWGDLQEFPVRYSLHLGYDFHKEGPWYIAFKHVLYKLNTNFGQNVHDIIASSVDQWYRTTGEPHDPAQHEALRQAWKDIKEKDPLISKTFSKTEYVDMQRVKEISIFEKDYRSEEQ